uniref:EXS domain-containing protein n=1 Tax=Caenorhabditis japonica TaxID=281687 RepID=A0A8R1DFD8_CAEJA
MLGNIRRHSLSLLVEHSTSTTKRRVPTRRPSSSTSGSSRTSCHSRTLFLWDIFMDWGLIDPRAPKEARFLREEMIYGSKWYYYAAIAQDFVLRLAWVLNVSLGEAWTLDSDFLTTVTAPFEVFRRFIWNYFRLENEHVNNCGQFRAVRDISVKPIRKGDLESLLSKMDQMDGVTHRGHDLMERVKKQKKSAKASRQLLRKNRFNRMIAAAPVVTTTFIDTTNTNS